MMKRIDLYIKVEVDLPNDENPQKIAEELCRMLRKVYSVRKAELSHLAEHEPGN